MRPPDSILVPLRSFATAIRHPRVVFSLYVAVTIPALLALAPMALELDRALAHHPDATVAWNEALDLDFARLHPDLVPPVLGGLLFMVLVWTLFAGGVLACVRLEQRCRFGEFLAEGGRAFFRNARVVLVLALALLVWSWGYDLLKDRMDAGLRREGSPWKILAWRSGLEVAYAAGYFLLSFGAHLAMAILSVQGRRSAISGWLRAAGFVLRHPIRCSVSLAVMMAIWVLGLFLLGRITAAQLTGGGNLWLGLVSSQLGILYFQAGGVALLVLARTLVMPPVDQALVETPRLRELRATHAVREVHVEPLEI